MAQEISPYSRYGLGDVQSSDVSASKAMGGLSAAYLSPIQPNYSNPASYSTLSLTTLEAGFSFSTKTLALKDSSFKTGDGFIDYFALSFPAGKRGGISMGLSPYTKMNYSFSQTVNDSATGSYNRLYNGSGRLYKVYFGSGWQVAGSNTSKHKLSIGANANVLFGQLRYSEIINFADTTYTLSTRKNLVTRVADVVFDLGLQWVVRLNKLDTASTKAGAKRPDTHMTIGFYGSVPANLTAHIDETYDRLLSSSGTLSVIDTLTYSAVSKQKLNTPPKFGAGVSFGKGYNWTVGVDASYTMWKNFVDINEHLPLRNDYRIAIGGEICPNPIANSFIKRTFYRIGAYYDNGYLTLNGQDIKQYAVTFGFGIPIKPENKGGLVAFPYLNLSFEAGSRGTNSGNLVAESFFNGTISFTLNNKWFIKPKYD